MGLVQNYAGVFQKEKWQRISSLNPGTSGTLIFAPASCIFITFISFPFYKLALSSLKGCNPGKNSRRQTEQEKG